MHKNKSAKVRSVHLSFCWNEVSDDATNTSTAFVTGSS